MKYLLIFIFLSPVFALQKDVPPVKNFNLERYLGKWYEIARLDNRFQKNLDNVTATYLKKKKKGIRVINKGFNKEKGKWSDVKGVGYFYNKKAKAEKLGLLKISFFRPLYLPYIIFDLDSNYEYAFVTAANKNYLWLLARKPSVSKKVFDKFLLKSKKYGFDTSKLIVVKHDKK